MLTLKEVVKSKLCIGCGICTVDPFVGDMIFGKENDCFIPENYTISDNSIANIICPGKGYEIIKDGGNIFGNSSDYDIDLGYYNFFTAARTEDPKILENASSGGVMTSLLLYLLSEKIVDKVSVTQFVCDESGVSTRSFLTSNKKDILSAQGSKYCPVNVSSLIQELHNFMGKVAVVGTPCVIAGIRAIQKNQPGFFLSEIVLTISNFCGGFKSFKNISRLAEIHNVDYRSLKDFRYRGGGQPGSLRFITVDGEEASTPYPRYVGLTGQSKMLRCHLCVDATGELADIACGDAWIPKFEKDKYPWSVILSRSSMCTGIIRDMQKSNLIALSDMTIEEVKLSQRFNLKSKKKRQVARTKLYKMIRYKLPAFDGGYYSETTDIGTEIKVYLMHRVKSFLEKVRFYQAIYGHFKTK